MSQEICEVEEIKRKDGNSELKISFPPEVYRIFERAAKRKGKSVEDYVNDAIHAFVNKEC